MRHLAFALFLLLPIAACSQPAPLSVTDAWARETMGNTESAAIFMTISSPQADRLIGAATPVAARTDLMTMEGDGGAMAMVYIDAIDIPANEPVSLDPMGLHVWLANLHEPLQAGDDFQLTLRFEKAGEQEVTVSVIAANAMPPMPGMDM